MNSPAALLALPSAVVLLLLLVHSARALRAKTAVAFWSSVLAYGLLRGLAVRWITEVGLGGTAPYRMHAEGVSLLGVGIQEIAGWAIVAYIAWQLAATFAGRITREHTAFTIVLWSCFFLGAISWAVESAAIAAGWWHWTIPGRSAVFLRVPTIGIVDWFFVGIDFLAPFILWRSNAPKVLKIGSLFFFPLHFGSHLLTSPLPHVGITPMAIVHWLLIAIVIWGALRTSIHVDEQKEYSLRLVLIGLAIMLLDIALVLLFIADTPALLVSLLPVLAFVAISMRPHAAPFIAMATGLAAAIWPPLAATALLAVSGGITSARRRFARPLAIILIAAIALFVPWWHLRAARAESALKATLDNAIRLRDSGKIEDAEKVLVQAAKDHHNSHVPHALLGEIYYKTGRSIQAATAYGEATSIKQDYVDGFKYLAVINLTSGALDAAEVQLAQARRIAPNDLEIHYLSERVAGREVDATLALLSRRGESYYRNLASLAFEINDSVGASRFLAAGMDRFPQNSALYELAIKAALASRDYEQARKAAARWIKAMPADPSAQRAARALNVVP